MQSVRFFHVTQSASVMSQEFEEHNDVNDTVATYKDCLDTKCPFHKKLGEHYHKVTLKEDLVMFWNLNISPHPIRFDAGKRPNRFIVEDK